jgi:hypothetical protein
MVLASLCVGDMIGRSGGRMGGGGGGGGRKGAGPLGRGGRCLFFKRGRGPAGNGGYQRDNQNRRGIF